MATEKTLQAKISRLLRDNGMLVFKFASPSHRGVPDLLVITDTGYTFYIEVKHPNGKGRLSKLQELTIQAIRQQGAMVYVINSIEEVESIIDGLDSSPSKGSGLYI